MLIRTVFQDTNLIGRLEAAVENSLKKADLNPKGLALLQFKRDSEGHHHFGHGFEVAYIDRMIEFYLEPEFIKEMPDDVLQAVVNHEICHCKDMEEKLYCHEIFIMGTSAENNPFYAMAKEMDLSNSDYLTSKRQLSLFGKESYSVYHRYGLEVFFKSMEDQMKYFDSFPRTNSSYRAMESCVLSLFKEYIKSQLDNYQSPEMKQSIVTISKGLRTCLDAINSTDTVWLEKTPMLFYTGYALTIEHDLVDTYLSDIILHTKTPRKAEALNYLENYMAFKKKECNDVLEVVRKTFGITG